MKLSNVSRRLFALCVLALLLAFMLVPVTAVTAGPGSDPIPVPGTPPPAPCSTGGATEAMSTVLSLVIDVATAVVL
jgi:hypothetical protein